MNPILYYSTMGELYEDKDIYRSYCQRQRRKWSEQMRKGFEEYNLC